MRYLKTTFKNYIFSVVTKFITLFSLLSVVNFNNRNVSKHDSFASQSLQPPTAPSWEQPANSTGDSTATNLFENSTRSQTVCFLQQPVLNFAVHQLGMLDRTSAVRSYASTVSFVANWITMLLCPPQTTKFPSKVGRAA